MARLKQQLVPGEIQIHRHRNGRQVPVQLKRVIWIDPSAGRYYRDAAGKLRRVRVAPPEADAVPLAA